jgi:hypothetical protein
MPNAPPVPEFNRADAKPEQPKPEPRRHGEEMATEKQVRAIKIIGVNPDKKLVIVEYLKARKFIDPAELSKYEASELMDVLNGKVKV